MVDGAASLMTMTFAFRELGLWTDGRGCNTLDSGAHFYEVYETADGKWFAVGAIEPQFYDTMLKLIGLDAADLPAENDRSTWPEMKERFAAIFKTEDQRRVGRSVRRDRRLRRPGAVSLGGPRARAQPGPRHLRGGRRDHPARSRSALRPDTG